jgi:hypothetical protein
LEKKWKRKTDVITAIFMIIVLTIPWPLFLFMTLFPFFSLPVNEVSHTPLILTYRFNIIETNFLAFIYVLHGDCGSISVMDAVSRKFVAYNLKDRKNLWIRCRIFPSTRLRAQQHGSSLVCLWIFVSYRPIPLVSTSTVSAVVLGANSKNDGAV